MSDDSTQPSDTTVVDTAEPAGSETADEPETLEVIDGAAEGEVQWYGIAKGYGFVRVPDVDEDIFVHHSQLQDPDNLLTGDRVRFRLVRTDRGLQAQDLKILEEAEPLDPAPR